MSECAYTDEEYALQRAHGMYVDPPCTCPRHVRMVLGQSRPRSYSLTDMKSGACGCGEYPPGDARWSLHDCTAFKVYQLKTQVEELRRELDELKRKGPWQLRTVGR